MANHLFLSLTATLQADAAAARLGARLVSVELTLPEPVSPADPPLTRWEHGVTPLTAKCMTEVWKVVRKARHQKMDAPTMTRVIVESTLATLLVLLEDTLERG